MRNQKNILNIFLMIVFIALIVIISIGAFIWGQQINASSEGESTVVVAQSPTFVAPTTQPPAIVTNTPTPIPTATITPLPTMTPTPSPTPTPIVVITHVQGLGRLETVEMAMQTVINLENDPSNLWEEIVGTDKLMLIAAGEVVAGFDLGKLNSEDIIVQGQTVTIILPAPEILYSRIDNKKTQVYQRRTGLLVPFDPTLESRARQIAEKTIVEWAIEHGIMAKAEKNGLLQIENLLWSLGFDEINIQVKEPGL